MADSDLISWGVVGLAAAQLLRSIPYVVHAWAKRSDVETKLIYEAIERAKNAEEGLKLANERIDQLEAENATLKETANHNSGQIAVFEMQLSRSHDETKLWEKRAGAMWDQLQDLYRAVSSSEQGKSLPPPPKKDW